MNFKKLNLILGWLCFLISFTVYYLTAEPTVSFWDTGEYITTSSKLQVGHPPGAPLYQMLGAVFSIFALEKENIGFTINLMSGFASALAVAFIYWSIVLILKKITEKVPNSISKNISISGAAIIGSLSLTFTDTFWFNAVEAEVYAMATLIMAVLFYLGLLWNRDMDKERGHRWLLLICFIIGLSFGVHFMGLLTIPAIVSIYYFKNKNRFTRLIKGLWLPSEIFGFILANISGIVILMAIFKLLLPGTLKFFSAVELLFVNNLELPFNSGTIVAFVIIVAIFITSIYLTARLKLVRLNMIVLCFLFIFIGFSSWLILPIRANANVVVNENDPSNARELLAYYNLEQYPKTYLFYGPLFSDQYSGLDKNQPYVDDNPKYEKDTIKNKYVIVNDYKNAVQNYNSEHASFLPRMWSSEHAKNYLSYTGFLDFKVKNRYLNQPELQDFISEFKNQIEKGEVGKEDFHNFLRQYGQYLDVEKPSFLSNIKYLFDYQIGYMYWRYFMWNFSGRQDDIQGKKNMNGNWISGINFIDEYHLGLPQKNLPSDVKNNKARNTYYMLPLLLGIFGLLLLLKGFLLKGDTTNLKFFWILLLFFIFTGVAIQVYTNVRPFEPRERDYSVVGSFYVFSILIGLGAYLMSSLSERFLIYCNRFLNFKTKIFKVIKVLIVLLMITFCFLLVPLNLATNNWDDHDRSGRFTAYDMAVNYLKSCDENAILFTIGDNDTFPLWYAQEIDSIRRDIRIVNTSLLSTDWYINQMKRKAYESDPIPSSLSHEKYRHGTRDYIIKEEISNDTVNIDVFIDFITKDEKKYKYGELLKSQGYDVSGLRTQDYNANFIPTENVRIPVNKENVLNNNIVSKRNSDKIVNEIILKINSQAIYKNRLIMLDIIANNNWERPIYFSGGAFGDDDYIWMKEYLQLDGMCYKLVPIKTPVNKENPYELGMIDSEKMKNIIKDWSWLNNQNKDVYYDVESRKNSITYRGNISRLVQQLIYEKQFDEAEEILDEYMYKMPVNDFGYYTILEPFISSYYEIGKTGKARKLFNEISRKYQENLDYYSTFDRLNQENYFQEIYTDIQRYESLLGVIQVYEESEYLARRIEEYENYADAALNKIL